MENNKKNRIIQGLKKRTAVIGFVLLLFVGGIIIFSDFTVEHTFYDGEIISAEEMNENFDLLCAKVNELEDYLIDQGIRVPTGTIMPFGGDLDKVPVGWFLCDGTAYSISEYSGLFDVIGSNFGYPSPGEFYVPDLRGMFLRGVDNGAGVDPDAGDRTASGINGNTGDNVGSKQNCQIQRHRHDLPAGTSTVSYKGFSWSGKSMNDAHTDYAGGNETRPINVNVNFIIKY